MVYASAAMTVSQTSISVATRRLLVAGAVGVAAWAPHLSAQQRPAAPAAPAASQARLETIQIRPNVYVIFGAGANVTAHVGEDGVMLVDSGNAASSDGVIQAVRAITPKRIRVIFNTSADADHTGGNEKVALTGVPINPDSFTDEVQATVIAHEKEIGRAHV